MPSAAAHTPALATISGHGIESPRSRSAPRIADSSQPRASQRRRVAPRKSASVRSQPSKSHVLQL